MTLIYKSTKAIVVLPDGARFVTPEQTFVGTREEISAKLRELNLAPPARFEMTPLPEETSTVAP
jgi:hypothetical protein